MCGHHFTNVADKYISESVHKIFEDKLGQIKWMNYDIRKVCTESDINEFNQHSAIVIGGGGFVTPASFYVKKETGWVIGIPTDLIKKIKVPIIVFSVRYNLFRGEVLDNLVFIENFTTLLDHSSFFSLRHLGDIHKVEKEVAKGYGIKLNFCSSLFGREYKKQHGDIIAFQLARDNAECRFGSIENKMRFIKNITEVAKNFSDKGQKVVIVSHTNSDRNDNNDLFKEWVRQGISCELIDLIGKDPDILTDFYYGVETTFTMRGHGQMIPMGLGCNVVSLISHDKIKYLLEDLGIIKTGVEINDREFIKKCFDAYTESCNTDFLCKLKVAKKKNDSNMETISGLI